VLVRRDIRAKEAVALDGLAAHTQALRDEIHQALFDRAPSRRRQRHHHSCGSVLPQCTLNPWTPHGKGER
jgi:hypothetical protein